MSLCCLSEHSRLYLHLITECFCAVIVNNLLQGVSVEAVDPVFQAKMLDMLKQTGRSVF